MSKPIKVDEKVYDELDQLREKGETFSMIIGDLLEARLKLLELIKSLEDQLKYRQWKESSLRSLTEANIERSDAFSRRN